MLVDGPQFYCVICNRNSGLFSDELCYVLYCTMKMGESNESQSESGLKNRSSWLTELSVCLS